MDDDKAEKALEILSDLASGLEAIAVQAKRRIAELAGVSQAAAVMEEIFAVLTWEGQEGQKIGPYEVAYKANNLPDKWTPAHEFLDKAKATINSRYHGPGYLFSYWVYHEGKIYRQKLKQV